MGRPVLGDAVTSSLLGWLRLSRVSLVDVEQPQSPSGGGTSARDVVGAYVALMKPRIIELLLLTTVPVMFLAAREVPDLWLVLATVVGGTLSAGLALTANVFYVVGYTMLLKRRTSQNIVWGGAAGCFPAMIGWTAVTNELAWTPVVLFLVVFFWTPPHFWSLGMRYREDYAAADVPMLPSVTTSAEVGRQIVAYSWVMLATSLALWPVAGMGWFYPAVAIGLGIVFMVEAYDLRSRARDTEDLSIIKPMRLFHFSNAYLALLFVAAAADPFLR